jgi:hypothetical protein
MSLSLEGVAWVTKLESYSDFELTLSLKSQQQASTLEAPQKPQNKPLIKPNNQTPNKKDGSVVIYVRLL